MDVSSDEFMQTHTFQQGFRDFRDKLENSLFQIIKAIQELVQLPGFEGINPQY
jgi:hypothetical protein